MAIGGTVYAATKGFSLMLNGQMKKGKARKSVKFWFSQLLGPALGLLLYKMEVMPIPGGPVWGAVGSVVLGWVGTLVATWYHLKKKRNGG